MWLYEGERCGGGDVILSLDTSISEKAHSTVFVRFDIVSIYLICLFSIM